MKEILLIIFFNLVLIPTLLGCGCSRPKFTQQAYDSHELIFIGKVIDNHINYKEEYQSLALR